jgi:branched-chain amino acid aminotransferase
MKIFSREEYLRALAETPRAGESKVLAFYDHRIGAFCQDGRVMLLPLDDHLVHRGDGVFETIKYVGRKLYQLDPHLARMDRSSQGIFLSPPCPWPEVRALTLELCRVAGVDNGMVRILLGRGPGGFGIDPNECPIPSLYLIAYGFHPKAESVFEAGVTAFKTSIPAKQSYLAKVKTTNYLPNMLMKREAVEKGCDYPLCFDEHEFLAEGSTENVVLVDKEGRLIIPELTNALTGTTLMRAVDLIKGEAEIVFRGITEPEIYEAREVIIIGTTMDAVGVVRYNGKPIHDARPGKLARRIRELLMKDLVENGVGF